METMTCKHCGTNVEFVSQDHGKQFLCTSCGKPGIYGFGAERSNVYALPNGANPFEQPAIDGEPVPTPAKPKSASGVLTVVGGGAIGLAAIFGLVGKGARHAGKAMKAVPTRTIPAQLPSKFAASPYKSVPASSNFAPKVAPGGTQGMTYVPVGAGIHGSRAISRAMTEDEKKNPPLAAPQPAPGLPALSAGDAAP